MSDRRHLWLLRLVVSLVGVGAALAVGTVVFRALAAQREPPERTQGAPPLPVVRVERVEAADHTELLRGYGVARAMDEAEVTAEISATVLEVDPAARVGATVSAPGAANGGAKPLVLLDASDIRDRLDRIAAELHQSTTEHARLATEIENLEERLALSDRQLETAREELRRIVSLVPRSLTPSDADRQRLAVFALEQARAELDLRRDAAHAEQETVAARQAVLAIAQRIEERNIQRTRIHAPLSGKVTRRNVQVGMRVSPGQTLFHLVDPLAIEVPVSLPASRYPDVVVGAPVDLHRAVDEHAAWSGVVARIAPEVDSESLTFQVFVRIEEGTAPPPIGTHLVADVAGRTREGVLTIPRVAFVDDSVFVAIPTEGDAYRAERRRPTPLRVLPGEILVQPGEAGGLEGGELVVVSNLEDVDEGTRLKPSAPLDADDQP